ncbi:hypothetical protein E2C01_088584 [Portunus trituberculatus]|uniref:Uncharacterized protein n=1 Tax=Portunus trituberculatus TaxID=210409 RepID=A0A5B7JGY9_PORTR|nr:hypothetical protein [Portunus trituberculatus]
MLHQTWRSLQALLQGCVKSASDLVAAAYNRGSQIATATAPTQTLPSYPIPYTQVTVAIIGVFVAASVVYLLERASCPLGFISPISIMTCSYEYIHSAYYLTIFYSFRNLFGGLK